MKIIENKDEIVLRYVPAKEWIVAGILTFIFAVSAFFVFYFVAFVEQDSDNRKLMVIVFSSIFGFPVLFFYVRFASIFFASLTTVIINRRNAVVDILEHRFYGTKIQKYYFHQIEKFKSHKADSGFSKKYFLSLVLVNRKQVKLKIVIGEDKNEIVKFIKNLNKYVKSKDLQEKNSVKILLNQR